MSFIAIATFTVVGLASDSRILHETSAERWVEWPHFVAPETIDPRASDFLARLALQTTLDQRALLLRQRAIYDAKGFKAELPFFDGMLAELDTQVRPADALEAFVLGEQLAFSQDPTSEFIAYGIRTPCALDLIVRHGRTPGAAPREDAKAFEDLLRDRLGGGALAFHLHNHPFLLDNPSGDIGGTVIPSGPDRSTWRLAHKSFGLVEARITNGASTFVTRDLSP